MRFYLNFLSFLILLISSPSIHAKQVETASLTIDVNLPTAFYVVLNDRLTETQKIRSGEPLEVQAGLYTVRLISEYINDYEFDIELQPGEDLRYEYTFEVFNIDEQSTYEELEKNVNLIINTDMESEIFVDGRSYGMRSASLLVDPGVYRIDSVHPNLGSLTKKVEVGYSETVEVYRYNQLPDSTSGSMFLLPGAAYVITGQEAKAMATYLSMGSLLVSYFTLDQKIVNSSRIFDEERLRSLQKTSLIGLGVIYVITTIDGFRKPKEGYPLSPVSLTTSATSINGTLIPTGGISLSF